ncbi:hypothetical protein [Chitinophaga sp. CB10]|uniref:hypothetical protein n=1 Tax=Chitinophaga sp. CB10 TaxID=1891659 RepID=UPI000ADA299D|nr:hypothetical protein [Chitinophaga sp. CB10]
MKNSIIIVLLLLHFHAFSQEKSFPKITGYVGIFHPIVTFGNGEPKYNFNGSYTGGLPTGINIWKSHRIGFSFEVVPTITASGGASKMSNFLFHPGLLVSLGKGFTLANRLAFETSGRYGFTPVLNKAVFKRKDHGYFVAVPFPARFGNNIAATVGVGLQVGVTF